MGINIPGGDMSKCEIISEYEPPNPRHDSQHESTKGKLDLQSELARKRHTFHRICFLLCKQNGRVTEKQASEYAPHIFSP